jgi:hypothetical protein
MATKPLSLNHFSRILGAVEQVREERGGLEAVEQLLEAYAQEERAALALTDHTYDEVPCAA